MDIGAVNNTLRLLKPVVEKVRKGGLKIDGLYNCIVKAALAKNFEFNAMIFDSQTKASPFALNPSLRGLCEDLIGLKYLVRFSAADRNEVALLLANKQTYEFVDKQQQFFKAYRSEQCILGQNSLHQVDPIKHEVSTIRSKLIRFKQSYPWKSNKDWPTVFEMAQATGLQDLYEYLYAATSSLVHFSPRNLVRMGWGDIKTQTFDYSTDNFEKYYEAFNQFYGLLLLVMLSTSFSSHLNCRAEMQEGIDQLIRYLKDEQRWPELVTFEEMNWFDKGPLQIIISPFSAIRRTESSTQELWRWA